MKQLIAVIFAATFAAIAAKGETIGRLYFDPVGNDGQDSGPRFGPTSKINPELPDGGGRLYLYWEFGHEEQFMYAVIFDVQVQGGEVARAHYYEPVLQYGLGRWQSADPNPPVEPHSSPQFFFGANVTQAGLRNYGDYELVDQQFDLDDGPFGSTLLGYVDVVNHPGAPAQVFLRGTAHGIAERGGRRGDLVHFGFGDAPVDTQFGVSSIADATIVPEPASVLLFAPLAVGAMRRR